MRSTSETKKGAPGGPRTVRELIPIANIVPDESNREITEDEDFAGLSDSIRVLGLLQPLHVQRQADGKYKLIDGERRWRAAQKVGLEVVPCDVWSGDSSPREAVLAGIVLNEQRQMHGAMHVARRLRETKNSYGLTAEHVAAQTGLPLDRVKTYLALFGASDELLRFFDERSIPLNVAAEFMRYEKATSEADARQLIKRYIASPMTRHELIAYRKKKTEPKGLAKASSATRRSGFGLAERIRTSFRKDKAAALAELEEVLTLLGYRVVEAQS
jgi:ParB family chromosome partitioning protein